MTAAVACVAAVAGAGLPEGVLAVDDADPEAFWFWELRDWRKALTPAAPGGGAGAAAGGGGGVVSKEAAQAAAVAASSNKKMVELLRKRRKDVSACLRVLPQMG